MSGRTAEVKAAEARLAQHREDAVQAKAELGQSLAALQVAQSRLLATKLDETIQEQRRVEQEGLAYSKNANSLYQRAAKWKAEQKRFRSTLDGLDKFIEWAATAESDLHAISGNLEYVCAVLEREQEGGSNGGYPRVQ